jgi:C-terminal processing protease CtpA/Prc
VDTRFNSGGNIHEQLSDFLAVEKYFDIIPHGQYIGLKGIGKTLGMPVPGTGTFLWWEAQIDPALSFGIPMGGYRTPDGKFSENNQLEPDIKIRNEPDVITAGRDQQIEAAVKALLKK